jgi:lipopolysaccharide transport system ATP-binding protein
MNDTVISIRDLGKRYTLGATFSHDTLRDRLAHGAQSLLSRLGIPRGPASPHVNVLDPDSEGSSTSSKEIWAVKDVSFDVKRGEVLGIIGANGAGKSTLLKILSQITEPTEGEVRLCGRVGSLLEVGTGMHPELSGRENVYLNGAILGMRKAEIDAKYEEIVDFAGIAKFMSTPIKRYSSGMRVRLGFAIAAHLEPEILIIDEVLSVGDAQFRRRCLGKMEDVASRGRTVLFVSHNMMAVRTLCTRALCLKAGQVVFEGSADEVVDSYLRDGTTENYEVGWDDPDEAPGNERARIKRMRLSYEGSDEGQHAFTYTPIRVDYEFWNLVEQRVNISTHLTTADGTVIFNVWSESVVLRPGLVRGTMNIPGDFLNDGFFRFDFRVVSDGSALARLVPGIAFEVHDRREGIEWLGKVGGAVRPGFLKFPLVCTPTS